MTFVQCSDHIGASAPVRDRLACTPAEVVENALPGIGKAFERRNLIAVGTARRERVGHFAKRRLARLFVPGDVDVLLQSRDVEIGLQLVPLEDGQRERRQEAPRERAGVASATTSPARRNDFRSDSIRTTI
jgi:hypothetical protein